MTLFHTVLIETLGRHFVLGKSRLVTLAVLVAGLVQSRTVNLSHLAAHLPGPARAASKYRRLQRFFQFVRLDQEVAARLVVHMLDLERSKYLALDRTNWKLGSRDINILVLAIVTRRFRVPLLFALLPHQGGSDTGLRIALMRRYLALFGAASIRCLIADREFIGVEWMDFLNENNIPFALRVRTAPSSATNSAMRRRVRDNGSPSLCGSHKNFPSGRSTPRSRRRFAGSAVDRKAGLSAPCSGSTTLPLRSIHSRCSRIRSWRASSIWRKR